MTAIRIAAAQSVCGWVGVHGNVGPDLLEVLSSERRRPVRRLVQPALDLLVRESLEPSGCPRNCPCDAPRQRLGNQRQPTRSIWEVVETVGFARKIDDGREAGFRLANHRLQPLGHLTAARNLSIRQGSTYAAAGCPRIVPEIVPASLKKPPQKQRGRAACCVTGMQRFFQPMHASQVTEHEWILVTSSAGHFSGS